MSCETTMRQFVNSARVSFCNSKVSVLPNTCTDRLQEYFVQTNFDGDPADRVNCSGSVEDRIHFRILLSWVI